MPMALGQQERFWNLTEPLASLATPDPACTQELSVESGGAQAIATLPTRGTQVMYCQGHGRLVTHFSTESNSSLWLSLTSEGLWCVLCC